jgi:hypothetical protein
MGADELLLAQSWLRSRRSITEAIEWRDTIVGSRRLNAWTVVLLGYCRHHANVDLPRLRR